MASVPRMDRIKRSARQSSRALKRREILQLRRGPRFYALGPFCGNMPRMLLSKGAICAQPTRAAGNMAAPTRAALLCVGAVLRKHVPHAARQRSNLRPTYARGGEHCSSGTGRAFTRWGRFAETCPACRSAKERSASNPRAPQGTWRLRRGPRFYALGPFCGNMSRMPPSKGAICAHPTRAAGNMAALAAPAALANFSASSSGSPRRAAYR